MPILPLSLYAAFSIFRYMPDDADDIFALFSSRRYFIVTRHFHFFFYYVTPFFSMPLLIALFRRFISPLTPLPLRFLSLLSPA